MDKQKKLQQLKKKLVKLESMYKKYVIQSSPTKNRLPSKSEIIDSFPANINKKLLDKSMNFKLKEAKIIYGKRLAYLNPKIIKKLKLKPGESFWGLQGQHGNFLKNLKKEIF